LSKSEFVPCSLADFPNDKGQSIGENKLDGPILELVILIENGSPRKNEVEAGLESDSNS
jgi:hypothetical protein